MTPETVQAKYFTIDGSSLEVYEKLPLSFKNCNTNTRKESVYAKWGSILNQDVCLLTVADPKLLFLSEIISLIISNGKCTIW